ncbi:hypothetical protein EJB05_26294, partial [Eragrostis curvula]
MRPSAELAPKRLGWQGSPVPCMCKHKIAIPQKSKRKYPWRPEAPRKFGISHQGFLDRVAPRLRFLGKVITDGMFKNYRMMEFLLKEETMSRKNSVGTPSRWNSDESISPRCVLDGCTTTSHSTTTNTSSTAAATPSFTATYTDDPPSTSPQAQSPPPPTAASRRPDGGPPPWKAVAEAWRSRSKRRLPSLRPTMSSALRCLSLRRPDLPDAVEVHEFCVLKPSLRTFSLAELKKATGNFSRDNVVGRGGFAKVYRGSLPGGELVAVKRLTAAQGRDRMEGFLAELGHVVNVSHPNIARLVGVGVDGGEHLVFPFSGSGASPAGFTGEVVVVVRRRRCRGRRGTGWRLVLQEVWSICTSSVPRFRQTPRHQAEPLCHGTHLPL